jgi:hypothetical protein
MRKIAMQKKIETIKNCNHAITAIAKLIIEFQIDSDCNDEISRNIKNNYIQSGLMEAIKIAADASEEAVQWMETELGLDDLEVKNNGGVEQ